MEFTQNDNLIPGGTLRFLYRAIMTTESACGHIIGPHLDVLRLGIYIDTHTRTLYGHKMIYV